jgi:N-acetylmuramoyl-L-alanine amidase
VVLLILASAETDSAWAQTLKSISATQENEATYVELRFDSAAPTPDKIFQIKDGKARLVIDWSNAVHAISQRSNTVKGAGLVKTVRFSDRGKGLRVVLDLAQGDIRYAPVTSGKVMTLNVQSHSNGPPSGMGAANPQARSSQARLHQARPTLGSTVQPIGSYAVPVPSLKPGQAVKAPPEQKPRYFTGRTPFPRLKPAGQYAAVKPVRKPVIVIDPGHGGYDPGALGSAGTKEKHITYAASLELRTQLEKTGRYKVIMTRAKDVYIPHEKRLRLARAGGADLFISIHADATARGSARGASVYTLSDRAVNRSKRLVNSQNWIMDVDLSEQSDPVGDILVDLAQRKTASQSGEFADILITELARSTMLIGNTHRRAGYFVLLAPDVPAVLLELGFLSNSEDEALLNKPAHRKKVISSVTRAINRYFAAQKP